MTHILQAICHNGELILTEKLDSALEGKTLKIMILEAPEPDRSASPDRQAQVTHFLAKSTQYSFKLPPNYRFDRDELYDR